jgi:hypothetical protein
MTQRILSVALVAFLVLLCGGTALAQSTNGAAGQMPAYYDDQLFTINLMELPPGGEAAALAHNSQINVIYTAEGFDAVLDAIQGDGFNPLWREVEIEFTNIAPKQYTSDEEILADAEAGLIELTVTDELYRCSVVGPKK